MFESLRRSRLQREGLSCGKVRRKHQEGDLAHLLRTHPLASALIGTGFLVTLLLLLRLKPNPPSAMDSLCLTILGIGTLLHWFTSRRQEAQDNGDLLLILLCLLVQFSTSWLILEQATLRTWQATLAIVALPHAFAPMILGVSLGHRAGLFATLHGSLLGAMLFQPEQPAPYLAAAAGIGFVAVRGAVRVRKRSHLLMAGLHAGSCAAALSLALCLADGGLGNSLLEVLGLPLLTGLVTGLLVGGALPLIEPSFAVTTQVSWLEAADLNHPLMRRLSLEAPGTYHHSLMVASIAEAAAEAISANAAMTRVCAYFHDIGKLTKPEYFIENMDPADNPHEDLTARMSALILIAHVKDGVDLGVTHKLNGRVIDVIEQHHGTSLAWFFYQRALDQKAEAIALFAQGKSTEDDIPQVSETTFRYPGPKPQFKEAAIISLADAVESSSRSLDRPTPARLEALIEEIIHQRMADGQLDECDLTLGELAKIKASFLKTLLGMMHSRVKYRGTSATAPAPEEGSLQTNDGRTIAMAIRAHDSADGQAIGRANRKPRRSNRGAQPPASAA